MWNGSDLFILKTPDDSNVQFQDLADCHNSMVLVGHKDLGAHLGLPKDSYDTWGMLTHYPQFYHL